MQQVFFLIACFHLLLILDCFQIPERPARPPVVFPVPMVPDLVDRHPARLHPVAFPLADPPELIAWRVANFRFWQAWTCESDPSSCLLFLRKCPRPGIQANAPNTPRFQ